MLFIRKRHRRQIARFSVAILLTIVATIVRQWLELPLGEHSPFVTYHIAVIVTAYFVGRGPALLATSLGALAASYYFIPPNDSLIFTTSEHLIGLAAYFAVALTAALMGGRMHEARRRAERSARIARASEHRLRHSESTLREHQERLELAQQIAKIGTFEWNILSNRNLWSKELEALYGLSPGTFGGHYEDWARYVHPEDRAQAEREADRALQTGKYMQDFRVVWPDGSIHWLQAKARVLFDRSGRPVRMIGINMDITERKRAEAHIQASLREKEVLLKEIHHRVKNNLQIICSLLSLQSDAIRDPEALAIFKNSESRVRSMALVHEKLYESPDLAQIDMREYLGSLIAHLRHSYSVSERVSLSVAADSMPLNIDVVIPCALIVNELVTNAFEHAFPDRRGGAVAVEFRKSAEGVLRLSVRDTGQGLPEGFEIDRAESSLGLRLVSALVEQLDARMTISRRPPEGGTAFVIEFGKGRDSHADGRMHAVAGQTSV